ncbi:MAG: SAM-dependent methyltransferase, partial [Chloroflexota bacterium]
MSLRFHEIAEANHRILNPFTQTELMLLGQICRLDATMRQLDLASGKGEMLCQWSQQWGIRGVGVDISKIFLKAARQRAVEL